MLGGTLLYLKVFKISNPKVLIQQNQAIASKLKKVKTKGMPAELKNIKALSEDYTKNVRTLGHINTVLNSVNRVKTPMNLAIDLSLHMTPWRAYWLSKVTCSVN